VQYEAAFPKGYECGGAYMKLLTHVEGFQAKDLADVTPYSVMFGPDKCGDPNGKVRGHAWPCAMRHVGPHGALDPACLG
jgi:hypothetical protein